MSTIIAAIDDRLEETLKSSHYRSSLERELKVAKLSLKQDCTVSHNGGVFYANQALIAFVHAVVTSGHTSTVLLDVNETPIEIENTAAFLESITDVYHEAHNEYLTECVRIRKARNVKTLVGV